MSMTDYIAVVVLVALMASWVVSLMAKWGIVEYLQVHGNDLISRMASCDFCLSWWACVAVSLGASLVSGEWVILTVPVFSTTLTRRLL